MNANPSAGPVALKCPQCSGNLPVSRSESLVCPYCGTNLIMGRPPAGASVETALHGMHLQHINSMDTQGTGLNVFQILAPAGWQFQGGCRWQLDNPGMPAVVAFQLWNPQGQQAFEVLPKMNFTWNKNPLSRLLLPPGSKYFGAEVRPPVNISEAFRSYIFPRFRASARDVQVLNILPLPDLPRQVKSDAAITPGASAEGGKARIRYNLEGCMYDEELYAVVEIFRAQIGTAFKPVELTLWFIDYLFSFRSAAGHLDASADLFTVMLQSFKLNPQWYAAVKTVAQTMAQRQINQIHHIGQIGQMISQAGSQAREQNLNDWYRRQDTYDRLSVERSRAIRDVDGFYDPHRQEVVELPSGYGNAWANDLGEYILTEDPNFNPNVESNQNWQPMSIL